jgi:hypothetical protein
MKARRIGDGAGRARGHELPPSDPDTVGHDRDAKPDPVADRATGPLVMPPAPGASLGRRPANDSDLPERRTTAQTRSHASGAHLASTRKLTELPELLTADEVAAWLKTTRKAIYAKAERGVIPGATHIGARLYFFRLDLLRWAEQGRVPDMEK